MVNTQTKKELNVSSAEEKHDRIEEVLFQNFQRNFEVVKSIQTQQQTTIENEISEYLLQNKPKSKGWLYRLSKKKTNKWSNLFFFANPTSNILFSVKPAELNKKLNLDEIQLYRCSFIEAIETGPQNSTGDSKGKKKSDAPLTLKKSVKLQEQIINDNSEAERKTFFVVDVKQNKTYLIKSEESQEVISVVTLLKSKKSDFEFRSEIFKQYMDKTELEYTGIIEVAACKRDCINVFHTNLKNYSFKRQYLAIRQGQFLIYNVKMKDSINLEEYNVLLDKDMPSTPENPYSFALEKQNPHSQKRQGSRVEGEEGSIVAFDTQQNDEIYTVKNLKENTSTLPKKKESFFSSFLKKISDKGKTDRLVLASDSEFKRKQWIFTINFYKSIIFSIQKGEKLKFQDENAYKCSILSQQTRIKNEAIKKELEIKQKDLDEIDDQNDYYNVFTHKREIEERKEIGQREGRAGEEQKQNISNQPRVLSTDKNRINTQQSKAHLTSEAKGMASNRLDSEEALMTLTFPNFLLENMNAIRQCQNSMVIIESNEIRTYTSKEIWEKFIKHFFCQKHINFELQLYQFPLDRFQDLSFEDAYEQPVPELSTRKEDNSTSEISQMEYGMTAQDDEPEAKTVFNKNLKYIVNRNNNSQLGNHFIQKEQFKQ